MNKTIMFQNKPVEVRWDEQRKEAVIFIAGKKERMIPASTKSDVRTILTYLEEQAEAAAQFPGFIDAPHAVLGIALKMEKRSP